MRGCVIASNTGAGGGPCWELLRFMKKRKIRALAEIPKLAPTTPPTMAPTEEELLELGEGDEVIVPVGWEDDIEEEAGGVIDASGATSGLSEKRG
jgi:hypothetical protein